MAERLRSRRGRNYPGPQPVRFRQRSESHRPTNHPTASTPVASRRRACQSTSNIVKQVAHFPTPSLWAKTVIQDFPFLEPRLHGLYSKPCPLASPLFFVFLGNSMSETDTRAMQTKVRELPGKISSGRHARMNQAILKEFRSSIPA